MHETSSGNITKDDAVPPSFFNSLSVRARHTLEAMGGNWTRTRLAALTEETIRSIRGAGVTVANEILTARATIDQFSYTGEEDIFRLLSARARHVLDSFGGVWTPERLSMLDKQTILSCRNAGKRTAEEIMRLRGRILDSLPAQKPANTEDAAACVMDCVPEIVKHLDDPLPPLVISALSVRARALLSRRSDPLTLRGLLLIQRRDIAKKRGVGARTIDEILALQEKCKKADFWNREATSAPQDFGTLDDYVLSFAEKLFAPNGNDILVLKEYMGVLNGKSPKTLDEVGGVLGVTRERVRQIASVVQKRLFLANDGGAFQPFLTKCKSIFRCHRWILPKETLVGEINAAFGWDGTDGNSVCRLLSWLGADTSLFFGTLCVMQFDEHLSDRYDCFLRFVNHYKGPLSELEYDKLVDNLGLFGLSKTEYEFFVNRGLESRLIMKNGKPIRGIPDIKPLMVRQYFNRSLKEHTEPGNPRNSVLRKSIIHKILLEVGREGLTIEELFERCVSTSPSLEWSLNQIRIVANNARPLDMNGTRMIGYERGTKIGSKTRYVLSSFFDDQKTIEILQTAATEVREYMERVGLSIVSVWKVWNKYRHKTPYTMPKLCFYMMMRQLGAGGLVYPDYPRICYPSIVYPKNAYAWEVYEYFSFCGRKTATVSELLGFFINGIGMEPNLAFACGVLSLGFARNGDSRDSECVLRQPKEHQNPPSLLLPSIRNYRDLSLVGQTRFRKIAISENLFDADGRALTMGAYVRSFLRALEAIHFRFSQSELAELLDAGWCRSCLKLSGPMFVSVDLHNGKIPSRFWKEKFSFGDETFYVNSRWSFANKRRFDDWAKHISLQAGISFEPYDIPDPMTQFQE